MEIEEIEKYVNTIIPNIERDLADKSKSDSELLELYNLYRDVLLLVAPHDFITYNKALEFEEDKTQQNRGFYHHRKNHMGDLFEAFNDMEVYDKYDMLLIMLPPRVGKSTTGIRFLSWIMGRHPESTQLATSYSNNITSSFYIGAMEIVQSEEFLSIFPKSQLVSQNAKRQEIWLKVARRYPSITFAPVGGSVTGRAEAEKYLYCDDLVSGIEEALSVERLEKLWQVYTTNFGQRKKDGCKEVHLATPWSVFDPITKLSRINEDNPRCKIIKVPAYDENGESQFDYFGGFSTKYYDDLRDSMDSASFSSLYLAEPIQREGLLYHEEDMRYYLELPDEEPDTIVAVCDSKALGKDHVASPIGYVYGDTVYIEDVVYDNGLPEVTVPKVANVWTENNVVRGDCEMNNGGNFFATGVGDKIKENGGNTSIRMFFTSQNKTTKIITYSDYITKKFVFRDKSTYSPHSEYAKFMKDVFTWSQTGKNKFDDAPDSLAMLAQMVQELQGSEVKIMSRQKLRI